MNARITDRMIQAAQAELSFHVDERAVRAALVAALRVQDDVPPPPEKLVRDRIPELAPGRTYRIADREEMPRLLLDKLREESAELLATEPDSREEIEEAADVWEVCVAMTAGSTTEVAMAMVDKAFSRGQFHDRVVMRTYKEG